VHTLALGIGLALVVIGLVAYVGSGTASVTALVPSFLGVILAALGGFAMARPAAWMAWRCSGSSGRSKGSPRSSRCSAVRWWSGHGRPWRRRSPPC
jgi:hypothetical protein